MKDRIKLILIGLGFIFGLQVLISLGFTALAYWSASGSGSDGMQGTVSLLVLGAALGAFLIGGFVIGWMSEEMRLTEAIIAAAGTLLLSAGIHAILMQADLAQKDQFVTGLLLNNLTPNAQSILFSVLALAAAAVGAYIGWHVKVPQEGVLDRVALLLGLAGAVIGPFVLLAVGGQTPGTNQPNLPWYVLLIVLAVLVVLIGVGFVMFTRETDLSDEISISPEHRRDI